MQGALPVPWVDQDVGNVGVAGYSYYDSGKFTVVGSGSDIWGSADAFNYVNQPMTGDGTIVARVTRVGNSNSNPSAKGGVMFRDGTGPSAAFVILDVEPNGCIEFMERPSAGANASFVGGGACGLPMWVKLDRAGNTFTASVKGDAAGSAWTTVGSTTVALPASATVGLAVTSHDNRYLEAASFDNVSASAASAPPPPSGNIVLYASDVAASAIHGSWTKSNDATAAAGVKLVTPDNGTANTNNALASPADYFDVSFNANGNTPYTIWMRLQATGNSKFNDSVWVQFSDARVEGTAAYPIGSSSALLVNLATDGTAWSLNGWGWQNMAYWLSQSTTVMFVSTGTHTLRVQIREDGAQIDQIVLSPTQYATSPPGPPTNDATIVPKS